MRSLHAMRMNRMAVGNRFLISYKETLCIFNDFRIGCGANGQVLQARLLLEEGCSEGYAMIW